MTIKRPRAPAAALPRPSYVMVLTAPTEVVLSPHRKAVMASLRALKGKLGKGIVDAVRDMTPEDKLKAALGRATGLKVLDVVRDDNGLEQLCMCWSGRHLDILSQALEYEQSLFEAAEALDALDAAMGWADAAAGAGDAGRAGAPAPADPVACALAELAIPSEHSPEVQLEQALVALDHAERLGAF